MSLPPSATNQNFIEVSAIDGGEISFPTRTFVLDVSPDERTHCPALAFLLQHARTRQHLLFDLGIRRDHENFAPSLLDRIQSILFHPRVPKDVSERLEDGGLRPSGITHICISHLHWDHIGDPRLFPYSTFIIGEAGRSHLIPGYPTDPKALLPSDLLPNDRTQYLSPEAWKPLGPFPRALDYFSDGSLYIVDAPGHLPGHVNVLARTSADGAWIYLAGDSAHDWRQVTGEKGLNPATYRDLEAAEAHLERIRQLLKIPKVRVLLAHDGPWYKENKSGSAFWPGKIESL